MLIHFCFKWTNLILQKNEKINILLPKFMLLTGNKSPGTIFGTFYVDFTFPQHFLSKTYLYLYEGMVGIIKYFCPQSLKKPTLRK